MNCYTTPNSEPKKELYTASDGTVYEIEFSHGYYRILLRGSRWFYEEDGELDFDSVAECKKYIEAVTNEPIRIANRIAELKDAFEKSGREQNFADPAEIDDLDLSLTEKKIMQQCRRPKCHGGKLGWICPKFWSE